MHVDEIERVFDCVLIAALYLPGFIVFSTVGLSHMTNIKRDFYQDVYTILNRILLTIWTKCAFRVLNPRHWSLAKQRSLESLKEMAYSTYTNRNFIKAATQKPLISSITQQLWSDLF